MMLEIDNRAAFQGQPGFHALIVGVSDYPYLPEENEPSTYRSLGLHPLSATALSANLVYRWLVVHQAELTVPLATCRLLLSPSQAELANGPGLAGAGDRATLRNLQTAARDWRQDASTHPDNVTFFYFAGHGARRTRDDAVLLLEDVGDGLGDLLSNAVTVNNLYNGMIQSDEFPNLALTQFYFIDACAEVLSTFRNFQTESTGAVWPVSPQGADRRSSAPIFYAAVPGSKAYSLKGQQTIFSEQLLECFNGGAGTPEDVNDIDRWLVSVASLSEVLTAKFKNWNGTVGAEEGVEQDFLPTGNTKNATLHFLRAPPMADVVLELDPPEAVPLTTLLVVDEQDAPAAPPVPVPLPNSRYTTRWRAGSYTLSATIDPPTPGYVNRPRKWLLVKPPETLAPVKVKEVAP